MTKAGTVEILLVEDNPNEVELTLHALSEHSVANRVFAVPDGAQALDFIFARGAFRSRDIASPPKVIVLDLKLPKVDGLEVLRIVKADERTRTIPVVVLTSSREEKDLIESYRLGANSYIVKPVEFEKFAQAIKGLGFYWLVLNQVPV